MQAVELPAGKQLLAQCWVLMLHCVLQTHELDMPLNFLNGRHALW